MSKQMCNAVEDTRPFATAQNRRGGTGLRHQARASRPLATGVRSLMEMFVVNHLPLKSLLLASWATMSLAMPVMAGTWSWQYSDNAAAPAPNVQITPFLYGKTWAYSVEIDDGSMTALTGAKPMLDGFTYTDAPPGVSGGNAHHFVGGAGIIVQAAGAGNSTVMQWDDIKQLTDDGWGVINHSYHHAGHSYGNPPQILSESQIRTDLFWSQSILAAHANNGRAPTHFVYPNGYTDYAQYLADYGLESGSLVSAPNSGVNMDVYNAQSNHDYLNRSYLDDGYWTNSGGGDPMFQFPDTPQAGHLHIDFTHSISGDANSADHQRWVTRLTTIENTYGASGADNLWNAPTGTVISYVNARKAAAVTTDNGRISVHLPDNMPGSRLTLKLTNVSNPDALTAPTGGLLYRDGDTVWVTTPMIGQAGSAPPEPTIKPIYSGATQDVEFSKVEHVAGVRIRQTGPAKAGAHLKIQLETANGLVTLVDKDAQDLPGNWLTWLLFAIVPDGQPIDATGIKVTATDSPDADQWHHAIGHWPEMQVWVTSPTPAPEPGSLALLGLGGLVMLSRKRRDR